MDRVITSDALFGALQKNWGWMLALGIVMVILGTIGLGMTATLTLVSMLYFGFLLLLGAGIQFVQVFKAHAWKGRLWHVLIAALYLVAGIIALRDPMLASATLTLMIAWCLVAIGVLRLLVGWQMRASKGWIWTLIGGAVAIALGVMIMVEWPVSGVWVIGMFVAIEMMFAGWSQIIIALAAKNYASQASAAAPASTSTDA
jgi:uncharacterized membrane protein HdeD (DUF308 family)